MILGSKLWRSASLPPCVLCGTADVVGCDAKGFNVRDRYALGKGSRGCKKQRWIEINRTQDSLRGVGGVPGTTRPVTTTLGLARICSKSRNSASEAATRRTDPGCALYLATNLLIHDR
jgi:hypothetical protein